MKKVHIVTIDCKHGVDVLVFRNKPTDIDLNHIELKFKKDNDCFNDNVFVEYVGVFSTELTVKQYLNVLKNKPKGKFDEDKD